MKKLIVLFLAISAISSYARSYNERESRLSSVVTNADGTIVKRYRAPGRNKINIPVATSNTVTIIYTNSDGKVINAYSRKIVSSNKKSMRTRSSSSEFLVGNTTNYVLYTPPVNYWKYKNEHIDHYSETTNTEEVLRSSKLVKANEDSNSSTNSIEYRIERLRNNIESNKVALATAESIGNTNEVARLTKVISRQERTLRRLIYISEGIDWHTGGYYYMKDGTIVTYRTALNFGFAGEPTNEMMRACYISVTNDPFSTWNARKQDKEDPLRGAREVTSENPNMIPSRRTRKRK